VPADDHGTERDLRSPAAARSDGGTHRADWSAAAFARLKSVIVTGMKDQVRFIRHGIEVVRAQLRGERLPLPLAATPDTSSPRAGINRPQPGHPVHPHVLGFDGTPAAINRHRHRAPCPSRRPARPRSHRQPDAATVIVRAGHASSVTMARPGQTARCRPCPSSCRWASSASSSNAPMPGDSLAIRTERRTPECLSQTAGKRDYRAGDAPRATVLVQGSLLTTTRCCRLRCGGSVPLSGDLLTRTRR
jgi:hypothetical protein